MNSLHFKTEEEKVEYIKYVLGFTESIKKSMDELKQVENSSNIDDIVKKAENFAYMIYAADNFYHAIRDKYRRGTESLTYGQEKAIVDCLSNVASRVRIGQGYELLNGGIYDVDKFNIQKGDVLKNEFIQELKNLDLSQTETDIFKKSSKR